MKTRFHFQSKVTPADCWISTMRHTYKSLVGVINIVFTCAMFILAYAYLGKVKPLETGLIILGCSWFTVVQPICIYLHHAKQLRGIPKDMELDFDNVGMHISTGGANETIPWKKLARVVIEPNMLILYSDGSHGYILTNRNLREDREEFLAFIKNQTKN